MNAQSKKNPRKFCPKWRMLEAMTKAEWEIMLQENRRQVISIQVTSSNLEKIVLRMKREDAYAD